ncbi:hypothetical protein PRIC2_005258 [Phytophthora ramorum]
MSSLQDLALNESDYVELLRQLISVSEKVQNAPGLGLIPQENLYAPPSAAADRTLALVGSHMDVVPANPEGWERDPFTLTVEGDKLFGRGTTDCLGHVALLTLLFRELAKHKVQTKTQVVCVLIASEENSEIEGVGVETQPCIGTAGAITWTLKATGKLFHSGLPNLGINGLELAMDGMTKIQEYFYKEFGPLDKEKEYNYSCPSTMKPTRIESSVNGLNQIPPWAKVAGDVRLSPFYDMKEMISKMTAFVDGLNANITSLEGNRGIACSLDSIGYKALYSAISDVSGEAKPFSISGSLPLVRDMQRGGFDLTLVGFGKSSVYHGDNEYCQLSDMKDAFKILARTIANVDGAQK